jgi:hypothetical protein
MEHLAKGRKQEGGGVMYSSMVPVVTTRQMEGENEKDKKRWREVRG